MAKPSSRIESVLTDRASRARDSQTGSPPLQSGSPKASPLQTGSPKAGGLRALDERSREVLQRIVDAYVRDGAPVGSRTLARAMGMRFSPATLRNVMSDLEDLGLLSSPHTSAGRLPTERGLRLFVEGLLARDTLPQSERREIEARCAAVGGDPDTILRRASSLLADLSACAGLVAAPRAREEPIRHIEFVALGPGRVLVVLVTASGQVENRLLDVPVGLPQSSLVEAGNYLSSRFADQTLAAARVRVKEQITQDRATLDTITARLVEDGLATWSGDEGESGGGVLIVSGHASLLSRVHAEEDLETVRLLFATLEKKEALLRLLRLSEGAEGVQIFIGAENPLFGIAGCSLIVAPCRGREGLGAPVGALGIIGPTRLDYARIIPMVDYTARVVHSLTEGTLIEGNGAAHGTRLS